jgi:endonuclease III
VAVQLERLISRLVEEGNAALTQPRQPAEFAYDPDADAILNDIEQYPQAFVLACLCNRQGMARQAWMVPQRLLERFGTLDVGELAQRSTSDWERAARQPKAIHRMPEKMAVVLELGVQRLWAHYGGDAARIWAEAPPSATVVRRFLEFYGAGPKIATMAVNILVRQFKVPLQDYHFVDISIDRQVRRVMTRLGLVPAGANDEILIYAAREAHAEFPGIFDLTLWRIGRSVCRELAPRCVECTLADLCAYAAGADQAKKL